MGSTVHILLLALFSVIVLSEADTYSVKIVTEQHVNVVDSRFLSFTIDPKYLFTTSGKYGSKECVCMATLLTPAYLRIAGPSTAHMTFRNTTISINDLDSDLHGDDLEVVAVDADVPNKIPLQVTTKSLAVTHREWRKFLYWAKSTGFDLVFALNNEERTASSMWDPNTALNILTVAEKAKVGDIFWELGYECTNQSIEEYLNDLETLRVIIETFPPGRTGEWKVVAGDVTKCLQADSKSDFKDYITLSNDMLDALLLNGNSSTHELERMTDKDRLKLLRLLSHSKTPLWLTENNPRRYNQMERAADWLASLGYSAKNGFSVHYRELEEEEMYEPTLSFYMALLFKNLVGERVLNVEMEPEEAILFAHCTSLRRKPIAGAVTLFGVNMDDEPARFSLKLSKREDGGDIMQFILSLDRSGNIVVNGHPMFYEGDIKPVVKRVRPYKTLLVNLPAKSFGFWVLANTKIEACQEFDETTNNISEADSYEHQQVKRSVDNDFDDSAPIVDLTYDFHDYDTVTTNNNALKGLIIDINRDLARTHNFIDNNKYRTKREENDHIFGKKMLRKPRLRSKVQKIIGVGSDAKDLLGNILQKAKQNVGVLKNKSLKEVKRRLNLKSNNGNRRYSRNSRINPAKAPIKHLKTNRLDRKLRSRMNINKLPKKINIKGPKNVFVENNKRKISNVNVQPVKTVDNKDQINKKHSIENVIFKEDAPIIESKIRKRRQLDVKKKKEEKVPVETDKELIDRDNTELRKAQKETLDYLEYLLNKYTAENSVKHYY